MPLNPNAQKLVNALRSGKYKQGRGRLTTITPGGMELDCCLGVACKVYLEENPMETRVDPVSGMDQQGEKLRWYNNSYLSLPARVREWLGFISEYGSCVGCDKESLANMNDKGKTFEEIAAHIESEPAGLFYR